MIDDNAIMNDFILLIKTKSIRRILSHKINELKILYENMYEDQNEIEELLDSLDGGTADKKNVEPEGIRFELNLEGDSWRVDTVDTRAYDLPESIKKYALENAVIEHPFFRRRLRFPDIPNLFDIVVQKITDTYIILDLGVYQQPIQQPANRLGVEKKKAEKIKKIVNVLRQDEVILEYMFNEMMQRWLPFADDADVSAM